MKLKKHVVSAIIVLVIAVNAFAQNPISGKVVDARTKEGLIGASIVIPNTTTGTITDINSQFSLVPNMEIDSIIVSLIGYETKRIKVTSENMLIMLEPTLFELDQIVVTANREEQLREDAPTAISILNKSFIAETKATSTPELLNKVSGVHIANFGNEQQSMSIRQPLSFVRTQLIVLEDGVPIGPTAITTSGDLKDINMAAIKSIEVVRGPNYSIYGSEAIGGAVNFITQGPSLVPTSKASMQLTSMGYKRVDLSSSNTIKKLGIFIGGYSAQRRNGYREDSDFDKNSLSLRADYQIDEKTKLISTATYTSFYTDSPGSLDSARFYENDQFSENRFTYNKSNQLRIKTSLNKEWNNKSKTFFTLFFKDSKEDNTPSYLVRTYQYFPPPKKYSGERISESYWSIGLLSQHKQNISFWNTEFIAGMSFAYTPDTYKSKKLEVYKDTNDIYTDYEEIGINVQDFDAKLINSAIYAHLQSTPFKNLKVTAALRYDRLDYEFDNHLPETDSIGAPDETNNFSHLSPKLGLNYNLKKNIGFYTNYSIGFAPPLFSQLYKEVVVPQLKPSNYSNFEIGGWMSFCKNKGYFDFSIYQSNGTNEIVSVLMPDGSQQHQSIGKTLHKGIEYTFKYTLFKAIQFRFIGSNTYHEYVEYVDGAKDFSGNEMNIAPRFIANSGITYKPGFLEDTYLGLEWQKIGDYYMDELNSEKYEGFQIYNLRTGYNFKGVDIWLHILNITDKLYASRASKAYYGPSTIVKSYSPGMHRTFLVGISYSFTGGQKNNNN